MRSQTRPRATSRAATATLAVLGLIAYGFCRAQNQAEPASFELLGTPVTLNVGLKVWNSAWNSWVTSPKGTGVALGTGRFQAVQAVSSGESPSHIPFATLRFDQAFVSMSAMAPTRYTLLDTATPGGFSAAASRREGDINAGYYLLPGLAVYAGHKQLSQSYGPDTYRWQGLLLGVNASAPLARGLALYGNAAVGRMSARFPASQPDALGRTSFRAGYRLGEVGLAYASPWNPWFTRSVLVTAGFRAQGVATQDYALALTDPSGVSTYNTTSRLTDTTQGFVLSAIVAF